LTLGLRKSGHCAGAELKISQSILNTLWFIALRCCYPDEVQQVLSKLIFVLFNILLLLVLL
jgi:hypothetical protein